jgi:uncharacterized protein (TIGR04255 family)
MSNHNAAKFLGFVYAPIPKEKFKELVSQLADSLREKLPRYNTPAVNAITVNVTDRNIATQRETSGIELHMVDANGVMGVKIGDDGLIVSAAEYISYEELLSFSKWIIEKVVGILNVTHFSRLSLRNINLFEETEGSPNIFKDIKNPSYWGRQEFPTLDKEFVCNGAATRHEYFSNDYFKHLQLLSGVVMNNQSYIPQDEWNIWKLRGEIPTIDRVCLLIDISGTSFQAPMNVPEKQHNVTEYKWELVEKELNSLHDFVNQVYFDIAKED